MCSLTSGTFGKNTRSFAPSAAGTFRNSAVLGRHLAASELTAAQFESRHLKRTDRRLLAVGVLSSEGCPKTARKTGLLAGVQGPSRTGLGGMLKLAGRGASSTRFGKSCQKSGPETGPMCDRGAMLRTAETGPPKSGFRAALWWMEGNAGIDPKLVCRNRPKWRPFKSGKE